MKRLKVLEHQSNLELEQLIKAEKNSSQLRIWQVLYFIKTNYGVQAKTISSIFGLAVSTIYHKVQKYNKYGKEGVVLLERGGRKRFYLTLEDERNVLNSLTSKAKDGLILTMNDIRIIFEKKIGHEVSDDYLWDVFKRHNWSKKSPRPKNPEQDLEAQEAFKKNSRKSWMPST
jgi:transposase